jgi:CRP/FNR family transcriptional regulator, cyclic AMP receptor protein
MRTDASDDRAEFRDALARAEVGLERPRTSQARRSRRRREHPAGARTALILEEDEDLARSIPARERGRAARLLRARVIDYERSLWEVPRLDPDTGYGLLMLDGLIARRVRLARAVAVEILGPGDILRPPDDLPLATTDQLRAEWKVFQPARLAVLDEAITSQLMESTGLSLALAARLTRRARRLTYLLAISHLARVEDRLLATFWHLGVNWGGMTEGGMTVPVPLLHSDLGHIVGARRPTVTLAMTSLRDRELVIRQRDGSYLLPGGPPSWLPLSGASQDREGSATAAER